MALTREPLLSRAGITSAISGLVTLLVTVGVLPTALGDQITTGATALIAAVCTVITVAGPLVHALLSRSKVTPIADPKDNDGNELVPAGSAATEPSAADALAAAEAIFPSTTST